MTFVCVIKKESWENKKRGKEKTVTLKVLSFASLLLPILFCCFHFALFIFSPLCQPSPVQHVVPGNGKKNIFGSEYLKLQFHYLVMFWSALHHSVWIALQFFFTFSLWIQACNVTRILRPWWIYFSRWLGASGKKKRKCISHHFSRTNAYSRLPELPRFKNNKREIESKYWKKTLADV